MITPSARPSQPVAGWELVGYLAILLIGFSTAMPSGRMVGDGADAFGTYWFYDWIRRCVEHGWDPSWTADFFAPLGKAIFLHTGNNFLDAVWSIPFQWVFGPDRYFFVFLIGLVGLNIACFRVLASQVLDPAPARVASFLWAANPYMWFELTAGRPTQATLWCLPAAVLYFWHMSHFRQAVVAGLIVGVAGWTYWFNLYFLAIGLAPLVAWRMYQEPQKYPKLLIISCISCIILILPAMYQMAGAASGGQVPGLGAAHRSWFDLPPQLSNNVASDLHGLLLVETQGIPLLTQPVLLVGLLLAAFRRQKPWLLWAMFLVLVGLALGPQLRWGEAWVIKSYPYLFLYNKAPFFERLWFPYRAVSLAMVPACLLVGAALGNGRCWRGPVLAGMLLLGQSGVWPVLTHSVACPDLLVRAGSFGGNLIMLPMRVQHDGLIWQTRHHMATFGGMGESAPLLWPPGFKERMNNGFARQLREACMRPEKAVEDILGREQLWGEGFRWVALRKDVLAIERARASRPEGLEEQVVEAISRVVGSPVWGRELFVGEGEQESELVVWEIQHKAW